MKTHTTESSSLYHNLEKLNTEDILSGIITEDKKIALSVEKELSSIKAVIDEVHQRLSKGGRLFYIGAGTSGRLGILDASECPPTFGVPHGLVIGIIAGGDIAIRKAVENAEDNKQQGWLDLLQHNINSKDFVLGISASGKTPYVEGALLQCKANHIGCGSLSCNAKSLISTIADLSIEVSLGPEYVTGSTRMKAGTAQKMILNMITTAVMIKLGKVKGNKMVDMQLTNAKLVDRGIRMIMEETGLTYEAAETLLHRFKHVRSAIEAHENGLTQ